MKKVLALMLALCMVFLMAACAGTTKTDSTTAPADNAETNTESTEKKTIAFLPPAMISPYYASCINGAKPQAEALGYELLVSAPDSESDYASQVQLVEDMIARGVDGIIICAINTDAIVTAVKKANEAGIPVVMFNVQDELADGKVDCYVTYDQREGGAKVADYMAEEIIGVMREYAEKNVQLLCLPEFALTGYTCSDLFFTYDQREGGAKVADYMAEVVNGAETNVAIIEGLPSEHTTARMGGFSDRVAEKYPNIHVVASQSGDWEREKGMNAAANMMQSVDIDAFFGLCDEMSLGAVQAVKQANGKQLVFSFDGNPNAAEAVKSGDLMCTLSIGGLKTGEECVNMIDKILKGETVDKFFTIETEVITKDNVDAYLATFE